MVFTPTAFFIAKNSCFVRDFSYFVTCCFVLIDIARTLRTWETMVCECKL
jgi:hypothetical protein